MIAPLLLLSMAAPVSAQAGDSAAARGKYGEAVGQLAQGALDSAYTRFAEAALLDARFAPALYNAGYLAAVRGDTASARRWWTAFLEVDATSLHASRARAFLNPSTRSGASSYEGLLQQAWRLASDGELNEAAILLEQAHQMNPRRWEAPAILGRVFMEYRDYDLASIALMVAYQLAPTTEQARLRTILYQLQQLPSRN